MDGMIEIHKLSDYKSESYVHENKVMGEDVIRNKMAEIFVISYYEELKLISDNIEKLIKIFRNSFISESFYIAFMDGEVAGFLATSDNKKRAIKISKRVLEQELGKIKGSIINYFLEKEFGLPIAYSDEITYIESVATHPEARGKGVATRLLDHIILKSGYSEFRLTVKDNNRGAISVYRNIGFREVDRIKATFFQRKYFRHKIYMSYKNKDAHYENE